MSTLNTTNLKNPSSGSNNIVLNTDGTTTVPTLSSTTITGTTIQGTIKSGTAVASTSGTSIDFTGIPSWVKRVTVMLANVSTNGTSLPLIQLGTSGGLESSGYIGGAQGLSTTPSSGATAAGAGFPLQSGNAANAISGLFTLCRVSGDLWCISGSHYSNSTNIGFLNGYKTLSGTLDRIRITTVNGTDTFDAGTINILYEG